MANGTDFDARGPGLIPHLLQHPSGLAKVIEVSQAFPHVEHPEGVSEGETVVVALEDAEGPPRLSCGGTLSREAIELRLLKVTLDGGWILRSNLLFPWELEPSSIL